MGFWNDGIQDGSTSRTRSRSRSRSGSRSPSRPHSRRASSYSGSKHYASRPSFSRSASSFLGLGGGNTRGSVSGRSSRSYTSARPRQGFVARVRRFFRKVYEYMRAHPFKVFMLVILPLITGGALAKLLNAVGIKIPRSMENVMGASVNRGVSENQRYYARGGARDYGEGTALPGMAGIGVGDAVQGAVGIAKLFM